MKVAAPDESSLQLVVFLLERRRYAVELGRVERVLRMVALTPFLKGPAIVLGVFDFHGQLIPVMNVRQRFGLAERKPAPGDHLLVLRTKRRRVAFAVDAVEPAISVSAGDFVDSEALVPGLEHVEGVVRLPGDGVIFVHDIDTFLSLEETRQLDAGLAEQNS